MITIILAILAIASQPGTPADFYAGLATSHAVDMPGFHGREWTCGTDDCWAGLAIDLDTETWHVSAGPLP